MEYNTGREHLTIPEYGRNVQKMIHYACTVKDKSERNKIAQAIVSIMGQLNAQTKDIEEFEQKLWNHLFIISDFQLDVDSPYEVPSREALAKKPERISYKSTNVKYKHYGKILEGLIKKASDLPDGEEKTAFTRSIANLMKKSYLSWNRDSVNDQVIINHLEELSKGKLTLQDGFEFISTGEILAKNKPVKKRVSSGGSSSQRNKSNNGRPRRKY